MGKIQHVGFVGLGNMGYPMAARIAKAGFSVTVYDIDSNAQERFMLEYKVAGANSPKELAEKSNLIITMLPDSNVVNTTVLGSEKAEGMASGMLPETILVDMSSSEPLATQKLGKLVAKSQIHMLDAPVSGGVQKAVNGSLAIMAGGEREILEICMPVFKTMGENIFFSGPLGSGHAIKALNNMLSAAGLIAAAEVLLVGKSFGINPKVMNDILNVSTGRNNSTENKMEKFIFSRSFSSGFSLDLMVKDLTTAVNLAQKISVPTIFSNACRELWVAAQSSLGKNLDHTDVVRWLENLAHTRLSE